MIRLNIKRPFKQPKKRIKNHEQAENYICGTFTKIQNEKEHLLTILNEKTDKIIDYVCEDNEIINTCNRVEYLENCIEYAEKFLNRPIVCLGVTFRRNNLSVEAQRFLDKVINKNKLASIPVEYIGEMIIIKTNLKEIPTTCKECDFHTESFFEEFRGTIGCSITKEFAPAEELKLCKKFKNCPLEIMICN